MKLLIDFNYLIGNKYPFYIEFLPHPLLLKICLLLNKIEKQNGTSNYFNM